MIMATQRKQYRPEFKAKVAIEALKEQSTLAESVADGGPVEPRGEKAETDQVRQG